MDTFYGIVRGHAQETIILSRKKMLPLTIEESELYKS